MARSPAPLLFALVAPWLLGCVGSGVGVPYADPDEVGSAPTTFEEIQTNIFEARCGVSCHGGGSASQGLSLDRGRSISSLVGVPSNEAPGLMRVAPGRAADSYIIVKISPVDARRLGNRMPRSGPPFLTIPEIRGIRRWIDAGATADWIDDGSDPVVPPPDVDLFHPFIEEAG